MSRPGAGLFLLVLTLLAGSRAAWAGSEAVRASIEALSAPGEATRRAAVEALVDALPASRPLVLEALEDARPEVQLHLIEVLGRDGSPAAIRALLVALAAAEPLQASRIRYSLVARPEVAQSVLEAWAEDPSLRVPDDGETVSPEVQALEVLLRRAEAERLFLARKSITGGTGSYRGQYQSLEPYRDEALDLCVGILLDRAVDEPGVFTTGRFEFLRTPDRAVDMDELIGMASHAFAELGRPTDHEHVRLLEAELRVLLSRIQEYRGFGDLTFLENLGRYADILVALFHVYPKRYGRGVDQLLRNISPGGDWYDGLTVSHRAAILLQVGRYEEAIREFEYLLRRRDPVGITSRTVTYYNMACAYAQWGERVEGAEREEKRQLALEYLQRTVAAGWSDVGWLDEDRDLDPIRKTDEFQRIRRAVLVANIPPEER